jgi:electron transport complex protein RnfD
MNNSKKFIVSHAPFLHNGSGVAERNYNNIIALVPAILMGLSYFGVPALGVLCLAVSSAIGWELLINVASKRPLTVGDGHAAFIGLVLGMLLPATAPFWLVITGTFLAIVIGKQIFGGIGANPFCPPALAYAILAASWKTYMDFDAQLIHFDFDFTPYYIPVLMKAFGPDAVANVSLGDLLVGRQIGGIGATSGLALIVGGIYLIARGFVRWEIPVSFIVGLFLTATFFHIANPEVYAGPFYHLLSGFALIGAFFLATERHPHRSTSFPCLIYGALAGS